MHFLISKRLTRKRRKKTFRKSKRKKKENSYNFVNIFLILIGNKEIKKAL